jgi:hypothetical protein
MDPVSLATSAVGLLVPLFRKLKAAVVDALTEDLVDAAVPKVEALYGQIRDRLPQGSYEGALLEGLKEQPDAEDRQRNLESALVKVLTEDRDLASMVSQLIQQAESAGGVRQHATDVGMVALGNVTQLGKYNAGRDQTISLAPPEARQAPDT